MTEEAPDWEALMEENVRLGFAEHYGVDEEGNILYRLTPAGEARVERLIKGEID